MAEPAKGLEITSLRSQLGRVRGLGSAKSGVGHWWSQRLTALALLPLTVWFVCNVISLAGAPYDRMRAWFQRPLTSVLMLSLVLAALHHMHLGLQVVIEDYVHGEAARFASLLVMRAVTVLLALTAIVSVLKLSL